MVGNSFESSILLLIPVLFQELPYPNPDHRPSNNFTVSTNLSHMKLLLPLVFSLLLLFSCVIFSSTGDELSSGIVSSDHQLTRVGARSLKSVSLSEESSELVALLNGTVYFGDKTSGKVIWSFSSGGPIYSSYQADLYEDEENLWAGAGPSGGFYVDYGDDWQLYAHGKHSSGMKLSMSIEEFIKITPHIWEDGAVILGSKKTTVFVVDAITGRLVRTYKSRDSSFASQSDDEGSNNKEILKSADKSSATQVIYVTRTDYSLQTFGANSDQILWNMNVGMIEAAFLCKQVENPMEGLNLSNELGSESDQYFYLPSPCQSRRMAVQRQDKPEFSSGAIDGEDKLPLPAPKPTRPSKSEDGDSLDSHRERMMLPDSSPNTALHVQTEADTLSNVRPNNHGENIFPLPEISTVADAHDTRLPHKEVFDLFFNWSTALPLILCIVVFRLGIGCYHQVLAVKEDFASNRQYSSFKASPSKRKKSKKSGKNNSSVETKERYFSSQNQDGSAPTESDNQALLDLNKLADGDTRGCRIGKLFVSSNKEIAKGSNGTVVLEGIYEGRQVAVKRLVQAHHDVAFKEIQNLIASDKHPNIVRWYGVEYDKDFVYLSLERCTCSLDDMIQVYSGSYVNPVLHSDQSSRAAIEYKHRLDSVKGIMKDLTLWKANGHPSPLLLMLMWNVVSGLVHLHELGIIHRDLKPQNVLVIKEKYLCAKLSDMGISRRLLGDMSSLGRHATGCGSSGWQSPEQLLHGRQTRAVDLFSLGCVLFFCITGGRHPFGDPLERDINIVKNRMDLFLLEFIPEAEDLISRLLRPDPEQRPKALEVLHHPLFWNSEMRLSFLRDTSDRVELEDREPCSDLLNELERIGPTALGGKWNEKMEAAFISNIGHYRRYKFDSVRDLLRVMRNKLNHYRELPKEIQELVGPVPEGYDGYFASRFPKLLMEVYMVVCRYCREEECFLKYFEGIP